MHTALNAFDYLNFDYWSTIKKRITHETEISNKNIAF